MLSRSLFAFVVVASVAAISSAFTPAPVYREPPKPKAVSLFTAMQGTWQLNNVYANGRLRKGGMAIRVSQSIRIDGNTWCQIYNNNGSVSEGPKYDIILDPTQKPATLDLLQGQVGGVPQVVMKGIVKVEGKTLTFCYVSGYQHNTVRPKAFFAGNQIQANGNYAMNMTLTKE